MAVFPAGGCGNITNETECRTAVPGVRCTWDQGSCQQRQDSAVVEDVCNIKGRKLLSEESGWLSVVLKWNRG